VDYPDAPQELEIIRRKVPGCNAALSGQIVAYVQKLRTLDLFKNPGVAETIDWATALTELDRLVLDPETIADTIGTLLKYQDDIARIRGGEGEKALNDVNSVLRAAG
jgi:MoxR-like ATPase